MTESVIAQIQEPTGEPSVTVPRDNRVPVLRQKELWACQVRKDFERQLLRIIRMYEKSNPAISAIAITHDQHGKAVGIEAIPK